MKIIKPKAISTQEKLTVDMCGGLFLRQNDGCFRKTFPSQTLSTAITEGLVFPFHRYPALRANRKSGGAAGPTETANLSHRHRLAKRHLPPNRRRNQQVIGCLTKTGAEFFKSENRWSGFASGNIAKVSGAEFALLRGSLIAKFAGITQFQN